MVGSAYPYACALIRLTAACPPDEALAAVNSIMSMETFSLLDLEKQPSLRDDLTLQKIHKTCLLGVDLGAQTRTDPFQRWLHEYLRAFRYWRLLRKSQTDTNTSYMVIPEHHSDRRIHRAGSDRSTDCCLSYRPTCHPVVRVFKTRPASGHLGLYPSFFVSLILQVLAFEVMAVAAAYVAVLSVFLSNVSNVPPSARV